MFAENFGNPMLFNPAMLAIFKISFPAFVLRSRFPLLPASQTPGVAD
jgi:hypothetical protein